MRRAIGDRVGNIVAFIAVVLTNFLSNALPINGQTMAEISAKYASLFTPAGFTFSIWGLIYLSLLAFVFYQALPSQRGSKLIASISRLFQANCAANVAWIIAWHYDMLAVSMLIMLVILSTLVMIYRRLLAGIESATLTRHITLHLPFSLYTSWVTVATIANASILQYAYGWDAVVMTPVSWALLKLALAGAIAATVVLRTGDVVFVLVVAWACYGISVAQSPTPAVAGAATALSILALLLAMREGLSRLRQL